MTRIRKRGAIVSAALVSLVLMVTCMLLIVPAYAVGDGYVEWNGTAAKSYGGGRGTEESPFKISTAAQLKYFADRINAGQDLESCFILTKDIYYNDPALTEKWENGGTGGYKWVPAGKNEAFHGSFDGAGYTIHGLYIANSTENQGFIGQMQYGVIKNLTVADSYIVGGSNTGAIVGCIAGGSVEVINCVSYATVSTRAQSVGGIVGGMASVNAKAGSATAHQTSSGPSFSVIGCKNYGTVKSSLGGYAGGIVGYINGGRSRANIIDCENYGDITGERTAGNIGGILGGTRQVLNIGHCFLDGAVNYGSISGNNFVGGIVGLTNETEIYNSVNYGSVSGIGNYAGGIAGGTGNAHTTDLVEIEGCANVGAVSGGDVTGGIIGRGDGVEINNCMNRASVTGGTSVGGIAGALGGKTDVLDTYIRYCYNVGTLSGKSAVSGIAGTAVLAPSATPHIEYCFNISEAENAIVSAASAFFDKNDKNLNFSIGNGDAASIGVSSLAGKAGLDSTSLASTGMYTAGIEYPLLSGVPLTVQNGDAAASAVKIISADVRYNREGRDIGLKVSAEAALGALAGEVSYGFLIIPTDMLSTQLTAETARALDVPAYWFASEDGGVGVFNCVLTKIPESSYLRPLTYVAYAEMGGGYVYSEPFEVSFSEAAHTTVLGGVTDASVTSVSGWVEVTAKEKLHLVPVGVSGYKKEYQSDLSVGVTSVMDVTLSYSVADETIGSVTEDGQFKAKNNGTTSVTVTAKTAYGSASTSVSVYVGGEASDTVIVNDLAKKDNVMKLTCNELVHVYNTISKNDGFIFEYNGFVLVYDSGNYTATTIDNLMSIREKYMREAGLGDEEIASSSYKLEYVWILSHYHGDHFGGMLENLYKSVYLSVSEAYLPATTAVASRQNEIINSMKLNNPSVVVRKVNFSQLITKEFTPGFTVDIMGSVYNWYSSSLSTNTMKENSSSMWARISCNGRAFLMTGDTYDNIGTVDGVTSNGVLTMYNYYKNLNGVDYLACDVIKTMHHGNLSSCPELYEHIKPKYTIFAIYVSEADTDVLTDAVKYGEAIHLDGEAYFTVEADGTLICSKASSYEHNEKGYIIAVRDH